MINRWRVGSTIPRRSFYPQRHAFITVYENDRSVCQCHSAEDAANIVAAMNTQLDAPTEVRVINKPTFDDLSLSIRAINCLHRDWGGGPGIQFGESAGRILAIPNIHRVRHFGQISFLEVLQALLTAGFSRTVVEQSALFITAPLKWRKLWKAQK